MDESELIKQAREIEKKTFFPKGRSIDGAVYNSGDTSDFLIDAFRYFGNGDAQKGKEWVLQKILERKQKESMADPECGNWWLWTILNELGVSRVRE